jgi:cysteine-rich repeat protein
LEFQEKRKKKAEIRGKTEETGEIIQDDMLERTILKILFILLCLGLASGIVFYWQENKIMAAQINTSVTITVCGNGIIESGEECDDNNNTSGDGCSSACQTEVVPSSRVGGGSILIETTRVVLRGRAYPGALIHILESGKELLTTTAGYRGDFMAEIFDAIPGTYIFGFWAIDKNNLRSITFNVTVEVTRGTLTTIKDIFIPPTIGLNRNVVEKAETLNVSGQAAPQSKVEINVDSGKIIEKVVTDDLGDWFYSLDTGRLEKGIHNIYARASTVDGLLSYFSNVLEFGVGVNLPPKKGACPDADLNKDNRVNLIDFSILLYWWGKNNDCADQNSDGIVDLVDFSIMLYYWTG